MKHPVNGSCVCGSIAFRIEPPYAAFQYCHCSRCRKKSGSAHAANIFVPAAQFAWVRGAELVRQWDLEGTRWSSGFCSVCGSGMPWKNRTGTQMLVPAGSLDEDPRDRPRRNIHFASKASWYAHASDLETFDELPPHM